MATSRYVERIVYDQQSPAAANFFEQRSAECFTPADKGRQSRIDFFTKRLLKGPTAVERSTRLGDFRTISIIEEDQLKQHLKDSSGAFKILLIGQSNSISPLDVTLPLFRALVTYCGIFGQIADLITCFGPRNGESDLAPPPIRVVGPKISKGGRQSSLSLECAYILRFVELNHRSTSSPWSVRQCLIYHQLDADSAQSTWLLVNVSKNGRTRLGDYLSEDGDIGSLNPFELHLLFFDTAVSTWRGYLAYISEELLVQAERAIIAELGGEGIQEAQLEMRQYLKKIEDWLVDVIAMLNQTKNNAAEIVRCYKSWKGHVPSASGESANAGVELDLFAEGFRKLEADLQHYQEQARALYSKSQGTSALVASILDLDNTYALKSLAADAAEESEAMHQLTERATRDAASVKVLTIVTLVYLPATVVSNFFSTSFVDHTTDSDGASRLQVAKNCWIFFVVSLPLTVITIYIWWFFVQKQIHGQYPAWWRLVSRNARSVWGVISGPRLARSRTTKSLSERDVDIL